MTDAATEEDKAWATIPCPFGTEWLTAFAKDVELVLRINPYYEFRRWKWIDQDRVSFAVRNHSNERDLEATLTVHRPAPGLLRIEYDNGLKAATEIKVESTSQGSQLALTDYYGGDNREQRLAEVDRSLKAWGEALHLYFLRMKRWGWLAPWRWYMRRVWAQMKPSSRRIVWMMYLITVAELFFFLFVGLIWWVEYGR
jgi:hypothetical protein